MPNRPMSIKKFTGWLGGPYKAPFVYYVGYLYADRERDPRLAQLADTVWSAYEKGLVELVQNRLDVGVFEYIAQKRRFANKRMEQLWRTEQLKPRKPTKPTPEPTWKGSKKTSRSTSSSVGTPDS